MYHFLENLFLSVEEFDQLPRLCGNPYSLTSLKMRKSALVRFADQTTRLCGNVYFLRSGEMRILIHLFKIDFLLVELGSNNIRHSIFRLRHDLPRGLVVRIRRSHRRGPGSIPGVGSVLLFGKIPFVYFG